jgi:predicted DCC family thiol-disulfide oxidoreductase YuxK
MTVTSTSQKPVVIYDGQCHFCIAQVERLQRLDKNDELEFLPRQDPTADQRFPVLTTIDFNTGLRLVKPNGSVYAGADALYHVAQHLPTYRSFTWLYHVPGVRPIAHLAYKWVAANRKRLGKTCEDNACEIEH